ncbi:MAG: PQQ-dependent sugar dehydrogenase [Gammaproteobacteria bacterium]
MFRSLVVFISVFTVSIACAKTDSPFTKTPVAAFDKPWAMAFLPDGRLLVTEKEGRVFIVTQSGDKSEPLDNVPAVDFGGQGGLGDVAVHPKFKRNGLIYLSYVEVGPGNTRGAAVARAKLDLNERGGTLGETEVIWRQYPKVLGRGHYGHRLLFDEDGYLWISSGDRQKFTPAQDMQSNMGKILRLKDDGAIPKDNPFVKYRDSNASVDRRGVYGEIWSLGHRNPLGIAIDLDGQLWDIEMGPAGGDELNRVVRGGNYGYPVVSNGDHYDGRDIPDHATRPEFLPPAAWWTPVISPGDLMVYSGDLFSAWKGSFFAAGLSSQALVRIETDGDTAREVERFPMRSRIRSVVQGPGGAIWLLEDGNKGRLLKLTP